MEFRNEFYFLSNMYPCKIKVKDMEFKCVESAFQACKEPARVNEFINLNGYEAKRLGRKVKLPNDWNKKKIRYMYILLKIKFSDKELAQKLISVDEEIVEENSWNDTFWGVSKGVGRNELGKLLMQVRKELING